MKIHIWEKQGTCPVQAAAVMEKGSFELENGKNVWHVRLDALRGSGQYPYEEYTLTVSPKEDAEDVTITVSVEEDNWSRENYVFAPAAIYQGNRFRSVALEYPPYAGDAVEDVPDPEIVITDVPRLSREGASKIELKVGNLAKPMFGFFSPGERKAFFFLFEQQSLPGLDNSICVEEYDDKAAFSLLVPARRSKVYRFMHSSEESSDTGTEIGAGQPVRIRFRLYEMPCQDIPRYFDIFTDLRKEFDGCHSLAPARVPFYKAFRAIEDKYNVYNWYAAEGYYSCSGDASESNQWQTGWIGGGMSTYAYFLAGQKVTKRRSFRTLEFLFRELMADNGLIYGMYTNGRRQGDAFRDGEHVLMMRKFTDVLYFLLKQFLVFQEEGEAVPEEWVSGTRKALTMLQKIFVQNGQFGQFIDIESGKLLVRGTSGAATGIGALALGSVYYKDDSLMDTAVAAAEYYFRNYVEKGISNGGPGEICQCPDSESIFGLLEAYITLYDLTGEERWIACAKASADIAASWCVAYDFRFPEQSNFARRGIQSTGAVWASIQNKHAAPGICTLSGVTLFKLYRATGEQKYLTLFQEVTHNLMQYVSLNESPFEHTWGGIRSGEYSEEGRVGERVNLSSWEGEENVGEFPGGSNWCEVTMLLNYTENPGVYILKDRGQMVCFDHVSGRILQENNDILLVELANDTIYDTVVNVFAENARQQGISMGVNPWNRYERVYVEAGGKVKLLLDR